MTLDQHYVLDELLVRSVIGELVLDLKWDNIEKVFRLPTLDSFYEIINEIFDRWYRENQAQEEELV